MQLISAEDKSLAKATIRMNAEHLQFLAAIAKPAAASKALHIIHVRLDGAAIAPLDVFHLRADFEHFYAQFVAGNSRITEERKLTQVSARIGAADTDSMCADKRFMRTHSCWLAHLNSPKCARGF